MKSKHTPELSGAERRRVYAVWYAMHARCGNPRRPDFARYGGAGVAVCERWGSFELFLVDMGARPAWHSIDRFPNAKGNYEPGNCRWATTTEQNRNRSINRLITFKGKTHCIAEWSELTGFSRELLRDRIDSLGWSIERALSVPVKSEPASECKNGHQRSDRTTYMHRGKILCRACNLAAVVRYKAKRASQQKTGEPL